MDRIFRVYKLFKNYISILKLQIYKSNNYRGSLIVLFDLNDVRLGPYYYSLVFAFHKFGFQVFIKNNIRFIANCTKVSRDLFRLPNVKIVNRLPTGIPQMKCWYFHDRFVNRPQQGKWLRNIKILTDVYSPKPVGQSYTTMPFPISPHLYITGEYNQIYKLRFSKKTTRVFFSGYLEKEAYMHPIFKDFFKKLDRVTLIETLKEHLSSDEIITIHSKDDIKKKSNNFLPVFELYEWTWSPNNSRNLDIRIKNEEWLTKLASSHFFLCAPGIRMPLCFNCIESLAVGTVPVLEYPEYFDPPLKHMENAIVFSGELDLLEKIKLVLTMDQKLIHKLSQQAMDYYDKYLHPTAVVEDIKGFSVSDINLYIHATQASYDDHMISRQGISTTINE
ncbi:MAG: hypothetical protein JJU28_18165 [Cyclobacteriaceae bacterium]|nr:hypothetical protein [Cyclobacteriaceae bacterium]